MGFLLKPSSPAAPALAHRLSVAGVLVALMAMLAFVPSTMAQDATPAPLGAADCTVDPIDPDAYSAAIAAATPAPPLPVTATGGTPADDATVAAVTDTMRQSIACTNAGDLGRLLALIDPSYAPTILGVPNNQVDAAVQAAAETSAVAASSTPLVDDLDGTSLQSTLLSVTDIVVLPEVFFNGQVSAQVAIDRPDIATVTATVYLRQEGDRYIITNYVYQTIPATPAA